MKLLRETVRKIILELGQPELDAASHVASVAHQNQFRRDGQPYIMHPTAVQAITKNYYPDDIEAQVLAMLHDVMEDGPAQSGLTRRQLFRMVKDAIPDDTTAQQSIMNALRVMTHSKRTHPVYEDYLQLVFSNPLAAIVKVSDLIHNLSHNPSGRQIIKYQNALQKVPMPSIIQPEHAAKLEGILYART
jgi:guanosine-3',5'-bis(diphosphate) 3'-pyrophosphohydrolase